MLTEWQVRLITSAVARALGNGKLDVSTLGNRARSILSDPGRGGEPFRHCPRTTLCKISTNGATPQPDEKTATGREVDSIDDLIRE